MLARRGRTALASSAVLLAMPTILSALGKPRQGTFLGLPYSFERPTAERIRRSVWDPGTRHILTPHAYGWGYSVNVHALARQFGLLET